MAAFVMVCASGAAVLTLTGFLARHWWVFDLTSHFRPQYAAVLAAAGPALLAFGLPAPGFAALAFALVNLAAIWPLYVRPALAHTAVPGTSRYRLLVANVYQPNRQYERLRRLVESAEPDVLVLVEINAAWWRALEPLRDRYPYHQAALREDNFGLAVFSRLPFAFQETLSFCSRELPALLTRLEVGGRTLTLLTAHPPPPKGARNTSCRNEQLEQLAGEVISMCGEVMVCGDFNLTPWSPAFRRFARRSGLRDSAQGFGVQPTWPANNPLLRIPIDHCLVSSGIRVHRRETGRAIGSDHFPVLLDFSFSEDMPGSR